MTSSLEKRFYLEAFRGRAFVVHVDRTYRPDTVAGTLADLVANDTSLVVMAAGRPTADTVAASGLRDVDSAVVDIAARLLKRRIARVVIPPAVRRPQALALSCRVATRLAASKLVVVDPRGGLRGAKGARSFITTAQLARLSDGGKWTKRELALLSGAVRDGVESINLVDAERLEQELFTYEGAGTLITRSAYCRVERLRLEDFSQAAGLLRRGEREGFLLRRSASERARLLLSAYGAWFSGRRLAGIAALDRTSYRRQRLAEISGLYTITRFQGEGVGVTLVGALLREAKQEGFAAVFACTSNPRAAAFFGRMGFGRTESSAIPARKWRGRAKPYPAVFVYPLDGGGPASQTMTRRRR